MRSGTIKILIRSSSTSNVSKNQRKTVFTQLFNLQWEINFDCENVVAII